MAQGNGHDTSGAAAFVIRIAGQAGPRAIEVTFGVPLDMKVNDLHAYVDKVCLVIDRQTYKGELLKAKLDLDGAEKAVITNRENRAHFLNTAQKAWADRGRKGPWEPTQSERVQVENWDKNITLHTDNTIPKYRQQIAELERIIALEA